MENNRGKHEELYMPYISIHGENETLVNFRLDRVKNKEIL